MSSLQMFRQAWNDEQKAIAARMAKQEEVVRYGQPGWLTRSIRDLITTHGLHVEITQDEISFTLDGITFTAVDQDAGKTRFILTTPGNTPAAILSEHDYGSRLAVAKAIHRLEN